MGHPCSWGVRGRVSQDYAPCQMRMPSSEECSSSSCRETQDAAAGLHMWNRKWPALFITEQLFLLQERKTDLLVERAEPRRVLRTVFSKGNDWERAACHRGKSPLVLSMHIFVQGGEKVCSPKKPSLRVPKRLTLSQSQLQPSSSTSD